MDTVEHLWARLSSFPVSQRLIDVPSFDLPGQSRICSPTASSFLTVNNTLVTPFKVPWLVPTLSALPHLRCPYSFITFPALESTRCASLVLVATFNASSCTTKLVLLNLYDYVFITRFPSEKRGYCAGFAVSLIPRLIAFSMLVFLSFVISLGPRAPSALYLFIYW